MKQLQLLSFSAVRRKKA